MLISIYIKRVLWALNIVVVSLLTWVVLSLVEGGLNSAKYTDDSTLSPSRNRIDSQVTLPPKEHFSSLQGFGLFKAAKIEELFPEASDGEPEITSLTELKLLGTVVQQDGDDIAIIQNLNQPPEEKKMLYLVGDKVSDGVFVYEIRRKEVILLVQGRKERLVMGEGETGGLGGGTSLAPTTAATSRPGKSASTTSTTSRTSTGVLPDEPSRRSPLQARRAITLTPSTLNRQEVLEKMEENAEALSRVKALPHYDSTGRFAGIKVTNIDGIPIASELGIQEGDIFVSVNGIPIDSMSKALELAQRFQNATQISITIIRNGEKRNLIYYIR